MKKYLLWILGAFAVFAVLLIIMMGLEPKKTAAEKACQKLIGSLAAKPMRGNFWTFKQMPDGTILASYKKTAVWYVNRSNVFCITPHAKFYTPSVNFLSGSLNVDISAFEAPS